MISKTKYLILGTFLGLVMGCSVMGGTYSDSSLVLAEKQDLLVPPLPNDPEVLPLDFNALPENLKESVSKVFPDTSEIVLATRQKLKPDAAPVIPMEAPKTESGSTDWLGFISDFVGGAVNTIPGGPEGKGLAALAIWLLAFKRSRGHVVDSAKSLAKLDLKDAGESILKATGAMHTGPEDIPANDSKSFVVAAKENING